MNAIELKNISKTFRLYNKPIDRLKEIILRRPYHRSFTALQDISFAVKQGKTFGIIGENGSGKSTLLKIIAGILPASTGSINKTGRVSALLELGAGFHPEFTGRENIYLNASLFGLEKEEIEEKEGEIINFSALDEFIDRPVKIYSSGMYVRLAFAIATSIDPDILIVDEALSVGDQRFQKKSIERMMSFRNQGKTIIFCSHSMYLVSELCDRAMWINSGQLQEVGDTEKIISAYEKWCMSKEQYQPQEAHQSSPIRIKNIQVLNSKQQTLQTAQKGDEIKVAFEIDCREKTDVHLGVGFQKISGESIFGVTTKADAISSISIENHQYIEVTFFDIQLISGSYQAFGLILDEHALHIYDLKLSPVFDVERISAEYGFLYMEHQWKVNQ